MTRKMMLIASAATIALAGPAFAEKGGRDKGGNGSGQAAQQQSQPQPERHVRPQRAERQQVQRMERPQMQRVERAQRVERPQRIDRAQRMERRELQRFDRPQRIERAERREFKRIERVDRREMKRVDRPQRIEQAERRTPRFERQQRIENAQALKADRIERRENRSVAGMERTDLRTREFATSNRIAERFGGRDMRGMRPMKAAELDNRIVSIGERFNRVAETTAVPTFYRTQYADTPSYYHRYDDDLGYMYRINRSDNDVMALMPLFGGYGAGDPWPTTYQSSYVPFGYQGLYYDTPDYYYRTNDYGIYRIDAKTQLISALVALLGGNSFGVGQMLPSSYGVYNVPMAYRSNYYDTDDSWYRYGDGFIYQIDPYSRRIEDRYPIYGGYGDYMVGQQWPVAYPDYNVPYAYQSTYYDTPQYNYRYANGAIYQVDPTSQLITAIVSLLSGQNFGVGQMLPAGYSTYNVPLQYRDRYYDTADNWYRYNNGYVYQVDPVTGMIEDSYPVYV